MEVLPTAVTNIVYVFCLFCHCPRPSYAVYRCIIPDKFSIANPYSTNQCIC